MPTRQHRDGGARLGHGRWGSTGCWGDTQGSGRTMAIIHCVFILSAIGIAYTDKLMTTVSVKREKEAHQH